MAAASGFPVDLSDLHFFCLHEPCQVFVGMRLKLLLNQGSQSVNLSAKVSVADILFTAAAFRDPTTPEDQYIPTI